MADAEGEERASRIADLEREVGRLRAALANYEHAPFGENLRERAALLNEAERIVHLGSWIWDRTTNTIQWSDEMFRVFGLSPQSEEPTAEAFFRGIHEEDVERVRAIAAAGIEAGVPEPVDFRVVRPDGSVRDVHMEAAVVRKGDAFCFVGTVLDVTERLEMEKRLRHSQKMEAIGTLAGGVAHDYNNHLQIMLLNLDLLEMKIALPPVAGEIVSQLRDVTERSRALTEQLLIFGRRSVSVPEVVTLDRLLDETIPLYESLLGDRVRLRRVRCASEVRVRCDKGAVAQVVMNLLVNARDAMPDGGQVSIVVDVAEMRTRTGSLSVGRYAVLTVEDVGSGIPPQVLPRIYEPFFTTKEPGTGTGLGLSIVHTVVTEHGGALEVTSAVGRGTTVRVLLPLTEDRPALARSPAKPEPFPQLGCGRVLLVEDEPAVRRVIGGLLGEAGYEVVEVENGADALDLLEGSDVDLVLSDVSMPRMTGSELARTMAAKHGDVPIVLMAGHSDSSLVDVDLDILQKPFGRDELLRAVGTRIRPPSAAPTLDIDRRTLDRKP